MIEKFNKTLAIWLSELDRLTLNQLSVKPGPNSWSLGQVYRHLIEETNWYNGQIKISLDDNDNINAPSSLKAKTLFEKGSFPNARILGNPLTADKVEQSISVDRLKSDMANLKADTNLIWEEMKKADSYGKSEHPGLGYLNCFEWLQYSEMHMRHHLRQKNRIKDFLNSK